jgi:hypothetical protein
VSIEPRNLTAQLHHRAAGNPPSTLPESAISNAFPGLEFDFRNIWRRLFEGIEIHEAHGLVVRTDPSLSRLRGRSLVQVGDSLVRIGMRGPTDTANDADLGFTFIEWSNALASELQAHAGGTVLCHFVDNPRTMSNRQTAELRMRPLFARSGVTQEVLPLIAEPIAAPGELTQSLCSPWQNDYRECACYYWAASRPDYVNVEPTAQGPSVGNNWLARNRVPRRYDVPDAQQISYDELFRNWQGLLRFVVEGRDHD